jgi:hypothetical protein
VEIGAEVQTQNEYIGVEVGEDGTVEIQAMFLSIMELSYYD